MKKVGPRALPREAESKSLWVARGMDRYRMADSARV